MSSALVAKNNLEASSTLDEYVFVPPPEEIRDDDNYLRSDLGSGDNDDDSYDHCEDVFSHGAQDADEEDDDDDDDCSVSSQYGHNKDNIIITVPSGLMKDLDDAHAAAELVRVSDLSEENDSASVSTKDTPVQEPEDNFASSFTKTDVTSDNASKSNTLAAGAENKNALPTATAGNNLSRASNKKRRKKLKLMKKAQAAASAAEALSTRVAASTKVKLTQKMVSPLGVSSRTTPRKVANIAVACARETMATYRQEVLCSSMS